MVGKSRGSLIGLWLGAWVALGSVQAAEQAAEPSPPPAERAEPSQAPVGSKPTERTSRGLPIQSAVIAPDGKHVAAVTATAWTGSHAVVLVDTTDFSTRQIAFTNWVREGFYQVKKDPWRVTWINSQWLAVDYGLSAEAVDLNGKKVADLGSRVIGHVGWLKPDEPLMLVYDDEKHESLSVINVKTRERRKIRYPMSGDPVRWAFDGEGQVRALVLASSAFWDDHTTLSYWYRPLGSDQWQKIDESGITDDHWIPLSASSRTDELTISSREGRDTWAVFTFDPLKKQRGALLAGDEKEDMFVADEMITDQLRSVMSRGMKPRLHWFDSKMADLQNEVDKALPGRTNLLTGNPDGRILIATSSDVDPGRWYLLDAPSMTMRLLLVARAAIDPDKMRPMEVLTYASKDGLVIPAYLTQPGGEAGPKPMVVMVHGGPAVRDTWAWDPEVQMLATNGYVVFQPQFRGSSGFGKAFEEAGFGQWGLSMQDDVTAGVEHLIKQGIADPKRICIYGASYGGYAAVWGLIKTPELYRCGISFAGVSDIEYMLTDWSDRNSNKRVRELQRFRIGDRQRDKLKFDEVSPLKHAQGIKVPLLIAHGEDDERVPPSHSKKLMKALDALHKPYEWVPLPSEGHGIYYSSNRIRFLEALMTFIDKNIGPTPEGKPDKP